MRVLCRGNAQALRQSRPQPTETKEGRCAACEYCTSCTERAGDAPALKTHQSLNTMDQTPPRVVIHECTGAQVPAPASAEHPLVSRPLNEPTHQHPLKRCSRCWDSRWYTGTYAGDRTQRPGRWISMFTGRQDHHASSEEGETIKPHSLHSSRDRQREREREREEERGKEKEAGGQGGRHARREMGLIKSSHLLNVWDKRFGG